MKPYQFHLFSRRSLIVFSCLLFCSCILFGQEKNYYFFRPYDYGSDGLYNPITLFANGAFDSFQILDREPEWKNVYWNISTTNVWHSLTSPFPVISAFGWNRFLRQEIFPVGLSIDAAQWAPNYALHLICGGMEYRKISEWYDYNNVPLPYLCGIVTSMAYEFVNEAVENGPSTGPNEDCIPDVLIFQPLGIILFSFDGIAELASSTFNLNDWSEPVAVSFAPFAVRNAGQNTVAKVALNHSHSIDLFLHFGEFALAGLSLKTDAEHMISLGGGLATTGVKDLPIQNGVSSNTVEAGPMVGMYYDRNNSLLASIVYEKNSNTRFRLCIYPGFLSSAEFSPGLFLTVAGNGSAIAGLTMHILPIGLSTYVPK